MEDSVEPVSDMLSEVAAVQRDQLARAGVLDDVRARVAALPERRPRRTGVLLAASAVAAACGVGAFFMLPPREAALTFRAAEADGAPGRVLSARADAELPLEFSDGSRVALGPGARMVVEATAPRGATLALERGAADVSVVHRERTSWVVKAGPARVAVTGTRFRVAWNPADEELTVDLREGSVVVSGAPGASGSEALRAGQTLRASGKRGRLEVVNTALETHEAAAKAPAEIAPPAEAPAAVPRRTVAPPKPAAWRTLAAATRYAEALRAAERAGFDSSCETLAADDLVLLGDVARLAGDPARAEQAYRAAHRRFPNVDRAAFALGLTAFEQRRSYADAAGWFETYLRQYPRGALAREAAGRLLEARHRAGDRERAQRAARDYLDHYPAGPHAPLARQLLTP
jgi:TolA-binding protein